MRRVLVLAALAAAACTSPDDAGPPPATAGADSAWRAGVTDVAATEMAFARLARDSTVQAAFETFLDGDATLFRPAPVPAAEALAAQPFQPALALHWTPAFADASAGGDAGYTFGPWRAGTAGAELTAGGWYLTVWVRQPDGTWRATLDSGVNGGPLHDVALPTTAAPRFGGAPEPGDPGAPAAPPVEPAGATTPGMPPQAALELSAAEGELLAAPDRAAQAAALRARLAPEARLLRDGAGLVDPADAPDDILVPVMGSRPAGLATAASADLGWAWGTSGAQGSWVRVWRHGEDGWRVVVDLRTGS